MARLTLLGGCAALAWACGGRQDAALTGPPTRADPLQDGVHADAPRPPPQHAAPFAPEPSTNAGSSSASPDATASGAPPFATRRGLTPHQVRTVFMSRGYPVVRRCYDAELSKDSTVQGGISVQLLIAPSGSLWKLDVTTTMSPELTDCIERGLSGLTFPPAESPTGATFPLVLGHR